MTSSDTPPSPQLIMQYTSGHWAAITLATATRFAVFTRLERGPMTSAALAEAAGLSSRGAQALLDGLVGIGLLTVAGGRYANTPEASFYLVEGKPAYMGAWATRLLGPEGELMIWAALPDAVKRGTPERSVMDSDTPFWGELVVALAPGTWPVATAVAARLGFGALAAPRVLDVGGGAGVYSAVLLGVNARARATQVDWPSVNRIAREYVSRFGRGDRFETRDGDFHEVAFGEAQYDVAIYSHIAHGESPESNQATFRRLRRALKPGGTLVVVDFLMDAERSGPPFPLLFHLMMLLVSRSGATWQEEDYRRWLADAGFTSVAIEPTPSPASVVFAR